VIVASKERTRSAPVALLAASWTRSAAIPSETRTGQVPN
jgi:hypothetical protein